MTSFVAHYNCGRVKNTEKDIEEIQTVRQTNGKKDRTKERTKKREKERKNGKRRSLKCHSRGFSALFRKC